MLLIVLIVFLSGCQNPELRDHLLKTLGDTGDSYYDNLAREKNDAYRRQQEYDYLILTHSS